MYEPSKKAKELPDQSHTRAEEILKNWAENLHHQLNMLDQCGMLPNTNVPHVEAMITTLRAIALDLNGSSNELARQQELWDQITEQVTKARGPASQQIVERLATEIKFDLW